MSSFKPGDIIDSPDIDLVNRLLEQFTCRWIGIGRLLIVAEKKAPVVASTADVNTLLEIIDEQNKCCGVDESQVIHPSHYNKRDRKECWSEMEDISPLGTIFFDLWSAYKYKYRAGDKKGNSEEQDKAKINNYIDHAQKLFDRTAMTQEEIRAYNRMLEELSK